MAIQSGLDGIAVVTGAASGIGRETAFAFAEAGAQGVCFADISQEDVEKAAEESKSYAINPEFRALALVVDVTNAEAVQQLVDKTVHAFGRIDYAVNSAGISGDSGAAIQHLKLENFDLTMSVNLKGTMHCIRAVSHQMAQQEPRIFNPQGRRKASSRSLGRGVIVNLASMASLIGSPGTAAYTASKHAVAGLTKCAALDLTSMEVRVNAVSPAWVDTPMVASGIQRKPGLAKVIQRSCPGGRMAMPEEVAEAILFLCQPSATYINGINLVIDGGQSLLSRL